MNKQTKKICKHVWAWIEKHNPSMHGTPLFDKNMVVWSNPYGAFVLDYKANTLTFSCTDWVWETELVSDKMWHPDKKHIHEVLDKFMQENKIFFADEGVVILFDFIKSAECHLLDMQLPWELPLPKKYKVEHYTVDVGDEKTFSINRFLQNREAMTKNNIVTAYHGTFQTWGGRTFPKDLFHPIKYGVSSYFGSNDYAISDFNVVDFSPF